MNVIQFRDLIIRPALESIGLWSLAAENLLIGTFLVESNGGHYLRQINGPALGVYDMEPSTHDDLWKHYLTFRPALTNKFPSYYSALRDPSLMVYDLKYATIMCRIKYLSISQLLPDASNSADLAKYWKTWYNTPLGRGDPKKFELLIGAYINGSNKKVS